LSDRFGPVPARVESLFTTVRCRKLGVELGFERMTLKLDTLRCYFVNNPESPYFESRIFKTILEFIQTVTNKGRLKQVGKNFMIVFEDMKDMEAVHKLLKHMQQALPKEPQTLL
jgi:transcription-repair coupling factor (superfamily II helicase)